MFNAFLSSLSAGSSLISCVTLICTPWVRRSSSCCGSQGGGRSLWVHGVTDVPLGEVVSCSLCHAEMYARLALQRRACAVGQGCVGRALRDSVVANTLTALGCQASSSARLGEPAGVGGLRSMAWRRDVLRPTLQGERHGRRRRRWEALLVQAFGERGFAEPAFSLAPLLSRASPASASGMVLLPLSRTPGVRASTRAVSPCFERDMAGSGAAVWFCCPWLGFWRAVNCKTRLAKSWQIAVPVCSAHRPWCRGAMPRALRRIGMP